jgi:hypothetical protein
MIVNMHGRTTIKKIRFSLFLTLKLFKQFISFFVFFINLISTMFTLKLHLSHLCLVLSIPNFLPQCGYPTNNTRAVSQQTILPS